jgi:hypothetical protein
LGMSDEDIQQMIIERGQRLQRNIARLRNE